LAKSINAQYSSIISCFGKLFTSVLNDRLNKFSDQFHVILENQAGFRKGYSTNDNLFILHILIHIMKKKKKKLFCAFIDFAKAFDTVWSFVGFIDVTLFSIQITPSS
jgi:hypothetical protein